MLDSKQQRNAACVSRPPSRNAGDGYPEAVENITLDIIENSRKDVSNGGKKKNPLQKLWQLGDAGAVVAMKINLPKFRTSTAVHLGMRKQDSCRITSLSGNALILWLCLIDISLKFRANQWQKPGFACSPPLPAWQLLFLPLLTSLFFPNSLRLTLTVSLGSLRLSSLDANCLLYQSHFLIPPPPSLPPAAHCSISHCSTPPFTSSHPVAVMVNSISHTPLTHPRRAQPVPSER